MAVYLRKTATGHLVKLGGEGTKYDVSRGCLVGRMPIATFGGLSGAIEFLNGEQELLTLIKQWTGGTVMYQYWRQSGGPIYFIWSYRSYPYWILQIHRRDLVDALGVWQKTGERWGDYEIRPGYPPGTTASLARNEG